MHRRNRPHSRPAMAVGVGLLCLLPAAYAGSANSTFPVNITLAKPQLTGVNVGNATPSQASPTAGSYCVNQSLSQATQATVTVTCSTNQFVSISPAPGQGFRAGTHGGAFLFMLRPGVQSDVDDLTWQSGAGTITTLQISRRNWKLWDILEVQVSY